MKEIVVPAKIGIIIPFFNGLTFLDKLLASISHDPGNIEILIVDNSVDDPEQYIKRNFPAVNYIRTKPGIGYGKACNIGYRYFRDKNFDFMLIANQDGYFGNDCVKKLVMPFYADNNVLITAPMLFTYQTMRVEPFFIEYYLKYVPELIGSLCLNENIKEYYPTTNVTGACIAVRLRNNLGGEDLFDPKFFMYYEDADLCERAIKLNNKIVLVPGAFFFHQHSHTTDVANSTKIIVWKSVSEKYYKFKRAGKRGRIPALYGLFVDQVFNDFKLLFRLRVQDLWSSIRSFFIFLKIILWC